MTQGLSEGEVAERVSEGKVNRAPRKRTKSVPRILYENIFTFFNVLCFATAGFLIYVGATVDSSVYINTMFLIVVVLNMAITTIQELRAKFTIERLTVLTQSKSTVIRGGIKQEIGCEQIVLGDVIVLTRGEQVPCDCEVLEGEAEFNESLLTGEASPVVKKAGCKVWAGSYVSSGGATVKSPLPGVILRYTAAIGANVKVGDEILVLESMKMEIAIKAPANGVLRAFNVQPGDKVNAEAVLATIG